MTTLTKYILGFVLSIVFTLIAFAVVEQHVRSDHAFPSHEVALLLLIVLAILQLGVQLILFLHLGHEEKPRWNLLAFIFAIIVVVILVGGTLWIMHNLESGHEAGSASFINGQITPQTEND
jgi:cytochrome o ubiquinol oxidase operon protein cyoD